MKVFVHSYVCGNVTTVVFLLILSVLCETFCSLGFTAQGGQEMPIKSLNTCIDYVQLYFYIVRGENLNFSLCLLLHFRGMEAMKIELRCFVLSLILWRRASMLIILNGGWDHFDINCFIIDTYFSCSHVFVPYLPIPIVSKMLLLVFSLFIFSFYF